MIIGTMYFSSQLCLFNISSLFLFLNIIDAFELSSWDKTGRILVMGLLCGIFGINVGHELGHRSKSHEQFLAKSLLLTSLYLHFFIEHNRGHHKHVGTPTDPSSAPYGQSLYAFLLRSISGVYKTAWIIAIAEQKKKHKNWRQNEMLRYQIFQILFCALITIIWGWQTLLYFLTSALIGILLLETVNYIEHYGLRRKQLSEGKYERAMPAHSWNSNHIIGRVLLFELSLHSDHHYLSSKKYHQLQNHQNAPQLPTGYPGSMILAFIAPLWFRIINKKIKQLSTAGK